MYHLSAYLRRFRPSCGKKNTLGTETAKNEPFFPQEIIRKVCLDNANTVSKPEYINSQFECSRILENIKVYTMRSEN